MELVRREFPFLFKETFSTTNIPYCIGGSFIPLKIIFCNGECGASFSEASLGVIGYPATGSKRKRESFPEISIYYGIIYDLVFNEKLKCSKGLEDRRKKLIENLGNFLTDEKHFKCLEKLDLEAKAEKENVVQEVLAVHLFGPLLENATVKVDNMRYKATDAVKCKYCDTPVQKGDTSFGNRKVWHGRGDILLDHSVIAIELGEDEGDEESTQSYTYRSEDFYDTNEPAKKRMKVTESGDDRNFSREATVSTSEVELAGNDYLPNGPRKIPFTRESLLETNKTLAQGLAQTITNAFLQVQLHPHLQDHFIPTFLANNRYVTIQMYNPNEDILLTQGRAMPIMCYGKLKYETILSIWLALNMFEFAKTRPKSPHYDGLDKKSKEKKCNFHQLVPKDKLRLYFNELHMPLQKTRPQNEECDDESDRQIRHVIGLFKELEDGLAVK